MASSQPMGSLPPVGSPTPTGFPRPMGLPQVEPWTRGSPRKPWSRCKPCDRRITASDARADAPRERHTPCGRRDPCGCRPCASRKPWDRLKRAHGRQEQPVHAVEPRPLVKGGRAHSPDHPIELDHQRHRPAFDEQNTLALPAPDPRWVHGPPAGPQTPETRRAPAILIGRGGPRCPPMSSVRLPDKASVASGRLSRRRDFGSDRPNAQAPERQAPQRPSARPSYRPIACRTAARQPARRPARRHA